ARGDPRRRGRTRRGAGQHAGHALRQPGLSKTDQPGNKEKAMSKSVTFATAIAAFAVLGMSAASAAEGFYVGGSALQSRFDSDEFDVEDVDDEDTGWKILAGFRGA